MAGTLARGERGVSLAEVLVAFTVLALAVVVALVLYDDARRTFRVGDNLTEQQQVVRIAFDEVTHDLRFAGYNHNPDGDRARLDEPIEAAFERAIVIRADFDRLPEVALAGGGFLSVSTGNDEIVAYVLDRPGAAEALDFMADVEEARRDGTPEPVAVDGVALTTHDEPPYTLYRVSLKEPPELCCTVEPMADNIRSLRFTYYDGSGNVIPAPGGAEDEASRRARAEIRRVGVRLEGLTRDPDKRWLDPEDTNPSTANHRKFVLEADVRMRNVGPTPLKDLEGERRPPAAPFPPQLYPGHCGGIYLTWSPNLPPDEVARYEIHHGEDPGDLDRVVYAQAPPAYVDGLEDGREYFFELRAADDSGLVSEASMPRSVTTSNADNVPAAPEGLVASEFEDGQIELAWHEVTENVEPGEPTEDDRWPLLRDGDGYNVYRGSVPDFTVGPESLRVRTATTSFADREIVNCRPYYYVVRAVDRCGAESASTEPVHGRSEYGLAPRPPENVRSFDAGGSIHVTWDPVREDVSDDPIFVDTYRVYRTAVLDAAAPEPDLSAFQVRAQVVGETFYDDNEFLDAAHTVYYRVTAQDDCVNESELSESTRPGCVFAGEIAFVRPTYHETVWGPVTVEVEVTGATVGLESLTLRWERVSGGGVEEQTLDTPGPSWTYLWIARPDNGFDEGPWRLTATVVQVDACSASTAIKVEVQQDETP